MPIDYTTGNMFTDLGGDEFAVDMSEWEAGGYPDPLTARTVYGFKRYLHEARNAENEVVGWAGKLPSGAKLTVFND